MRGCVLEVSTHAAQSILVVVGISGSDRPVNTLSEAAVLTATAKPWSGSCGERSPDLAILWEVFPLEQLSLLKFTGIVAG
jgi:hypothetical protein